MPNKPLRGLVELVNFILRHFANMADTNMSQAIHSALESLGEYTGIDRSYLWLLSADNEHCVYAYEWKDEDVPAKYEVGTQLPVSTFDHWMQRLYQGHGVHIPYVNALPPTRYSERLQLEPENIQSLMLIPLKSHDRLYGFIGFESILNPRAWTEEEILLLNSVGDIFVSGLIRNETYTHLSDKEHQFRLLIQHSSDLIVILNKDLRFTFLTPSAKSLLGHDSDVLLASQYFDYVHPQDLLLLKHILSNVPHNNEMVLPDHRIRHADGTWRWFSGKVSNVLHEKTIQGFILNAHDITLRKNAEAEVLYQAKHDPLTGLANRTLLMDQLALSIHRAVKSRRKLGLVFIDVDHFKTINDSLGHDVGDMLLKDVAKRLTQAIGERDLVARFGGDEFVVLVESSEDDEGASILSTATKVLDIFDTPFEINGRLRQISASAGAIITDGEQDGPALLRDADAAMYQAKSKGRAQLQFFDAALQANLHHRVELAHELRQCEQRGELVLYYQPVYDYDGKMVSLEALLRWQHPVRGMVSPVDFIPVAEDTGLIVPIGLWVLNQAVSQVKTWMSTYPNLSIPVAVNLSAKQLSVPQLDVLIKNVLEMHAVPAARITFELTESAIMEDPEMHRQTLIKIHQLGCHIAIDDFGTGYSSMAYLKDLPVKILKIDRSFVNELLLSQRDERVVSAMINLANELGMQTVAEGVEQRDQLECLKKLGCRKFQGYYFKRPMPAQDIELLWSEPS